MDTPQPFQTDSERDRRILAMNQQMLECVLRGDWAGYADFCSSDLSCFESETNGILAEGLPFHRFYFPETVPTPPVSRPSAQVTMARPHLRWLSDAVVVLSYTRLDQRQIDGEFITNSCCETRIWQKAHGQWLQVHVHRS